MKTSWTEIQKAEDYILRKGNTPDRLVMDAQLIINPRMRLNFKLQQKIYSLARKYGRKKIKTQVEAVHQKLFSDPEKLSFQQSIHRLFIQE